MRFEYGTGWSSASLYNGRSSEDCRSSGDHNTGLRGFVRPDEQQVAVSGFDGIIRLYNATPDNPNSRS